MLEVGRENGNLNYRESRGLPYLLESTETPVRLEASRRGISLRLSTMPVATTGSGEFLARHRFNQKQKQYYGGFGIRYHRRAGGETFGGA